MFEPLHAITPSDTRPLPNRVAVVQSTAADHLDNAKLIELALSIADMEVRPILEAYCDGEVVGGVSYMKLDTASEDAEVSTAMDLAIRYIGLRQPDAFPWRFVRHPERPELVRFEDGE